MFVCYYLGNSYALRAFFSPIRGFISHQDRVFQIIYSEVFKLAVQNKLGRSDTLRISSALTVPVHTVNQFPDLSLSRAFVMQS